MVAHSRIKASFIKSKMPAWQIRYLKKNIRKSISPAHLMLRLPQPPSMLITT